MDVKSSSVRLMVDKLDFGDRPSNWLEKAREGQLKSNHTTVQKQS